MAGDAPLSAFHLDLRLTPDAVTVEKEEATFSKPIGHELKVVPARTIAAGQTFHVTVRYHGRPASLRPATVWDGFFRDPGEAAAVGEPQIGPWWFAANETPGDKATYDVTVRVPRGQQAVSGGRLVSRTAGERWTALALAGRRADQHLPGVLRRRALRAPARHRRRATAALRRVEEAGPQAARRAPSP